MNILIIGSGGREHAIAWKLKQSPRLRELYCSPGNGGIASIAQLLPPVPETDWNETIDLVKSKNIDLTVVGPEVPLANGLSDAFRSAGLKVFGPSQAAARLEASKIFSKRFMTKYKIPTARYEAFESADKALAWLKNPSWPFNGRCVVKADGLAAGKGVSVCDTFEEAQSAIEKMMVQKAFGEAGEKVLIEERLVGPELSQMAFCDGKTIQLLPTARDYKRVFDEDKGPNTGGMGAVSPVPISAELSKQIQARVVEPFLAGIKSEKIDYRGVIYFGLMLTADGPYVLEFNVRFGDPETQVVLPLIKSDLAEVFSAVADGDLARVSFETYPEVCVGVVCASGGYPDKFQSKKEITGIEAYKNGNSFLFHAGTVQEKGKFLTSGGRVLNVVARGKSLEEARSACYEAVSKVRFEGMHFRRDIAKNI